MAVVPITEVLGLRARSIFVMAVLAGLLLFWPMSWGGDRLGLNYLRNEAYLWVVGATFIGFSGLTITKFVDWLENRKEKRRETDNILLELRSRSRQEENILSDTIRKGSSSFTASPGLLPELKVLEAKKLIECVELPRVSTDSHGIYIIPTSVWALMKGQNPDTFFQDIDERNAEFRAIYLNSIGETVLVEAILNPVSFSIRLIRTIRKLLIPRAIKRGGN